MYPSNCVFGDIGDEREANFREHLTGEVRGIPLLGTSVNNPSSDMHWDL
jgi:hypothetical protein